MTKSTDDTGKKWKVSVVEDLKDYYGYWLSVTFGDLNPTEAQAQLIKEAVEALMEYIMAYREDNGFLLGKADKARNAIQKDLNDE